MTDIKTCSHCRIQLSVENFYKNKCSRDGYNSWCKSCYQEYYTKRRHLPRVRNRDAAYVADLRKKYSMTMGEYEMLLEKQGNCCAICKITNPGKRRFHVDHCHETGVVRGILCNRCNIGIGFLRNDITILKTAVQYLSHTD